jgi:hypothetical protein
MGCWYGICILRGKGTGREKCVEVGVGDEEMEIGVIALVVEKLGREWQMTLVCIILGHDGRHGCLRGERSL